MLLNRTLVRALGPIVLAGLASGQESEGVVPADDAASQVAEGGSGIAGTGYLTVQLGFFDMEDDGDGNPFLDESLTVIEPVIIWDHNFTDRFGLNTKFSYDYVSSASIDRLSKFPDQSGASRDNYFGLVLAPRYQLDDLWTVGGQASFATEYDYTSLGFGLDATRDARDRSSSVAGNLNVFLDDVDIIRFDGTEEGKDDRTTVSGTVNWYQIMSPVMHGELGVTVARQSGFLETAYNAVVIEDPMFPPNPNLANMARGIEITEELPDDRTRTALFGKVRRSASKVSAYELGGRLYTDTWDVNSVTLEPRYYRTLIEDRLDMRLRYRFYDQTEAKYYQRHFTTVEEFRTQDSDLADFDAHTLGFKFSWYKRKNSSIDYSFDYTFRSDGLDYFFTYIGWTWSY